MITIEAVMLVLLGFSIAGLLVFLTAPIYRSRATRLAIEKLRRSIPLTEAEIRADKDRLRAEYAIKIHKLEAKAEENALAAAGHMVELNRRDAKISALEEEANRTRTFLDEHENARRVLEQTITERLPRVEHRLSEAKKLLFQRDRELAHLTDASHKQAQALEEAKQINAQQRDEIHRLNATIATRAARNRAALVDPKFEGEVALRAEIESLRAKTRDQSNLITRLQGVMTTAGVSEDRLSQISSDSSGSPEAGANYETEIARLRKDLSDAEMALRSVRSAAEAGKEGQTAMERDLQELKAIKQDQAAEIAKLKASLSVFQSNAEDDKAVMESKIALKARLGALQAKADEQVTTIQTLRAEIAAANDKLARQAAHYMDELRRLGAGTLPASGPLRRSSYESKQASITDKISAPRPPAASEKPASSPNSANASGSGTVSPFGSREAATASANSPAPVPAAATPAASPSAQNTTLMHRLDSAGGEPASKAASLASAHPTQPAAKPQADPAKGKIAQKRPGLLERITRMEKGSGAA